MKTILYMPYWQLIMAELCFSEGSYVQKNATKLGLGYTQVSKIINELENLGLVIGKRIGRQKVISLTEEGEKVSRECYDLKLSIQVIRNNRDVGVLG
jgi:predicted transcriptional regulator